MEQKRLPGRQILFSCLGGFSNWRKFMFLEFTGLSSVGEECAKALPLDVISFAVECSCLSGKNLTVIHTLQGRYSVQDRVSDLWDKLEKTDLCFQTSGYVFPDISVDGQSPGYNSILIVKPSIVEINAATREAPRAADLTMKTGTKIRVVDSFKELMNILNKTGPYTPKPPAEPLTMEKLFELYMQAKKPGL